MPLPQQVVKDRFWTNEPSEPKPCAIATKPHTLPGAYCGPAIQCYRCPPATCPDLLFKGVVAFSRAAEIDMKLRQPAPQRTCLPQDLIVLSERVSSMSVHCHRCLSSRLVSFGIPWMSPLLFSVFSCCKWVQENQWWSPFFHGLSTSRMSRSYGSLGSPRAVDLHRSAPWPRPRLALCRKMEGTSSMSWYSLFSSKAWAPSNVDDQR